MGNESADAVPDGFELYLIRAFTDAGKIVPRHRMLRCLACAALVAFDDTAVETHRQFHRRFAYLEEVAAWLQSGDPDPAPVEAGAELAATAVTAPPATSGHPLDPVEDLDPGVVEDLGAHMLDGPAPSEGHTPAAVAMPCHSSEQPTPIEPGATAIDADPAIHPSDPLTDAAAALPVPGDRVNPTSTEAAQAVPVPHLPDGTPSAPVRADAGEATLPVDHTASPPWSDPGSTSSGDAATDVTAWAAASTSPGTGAVNGSVIALDGGDESVPAPFTPAAPVELAEPPKDETPTGDPATETYSQDAPPDPLPAPVLSEPSPESAWTTPSASGATRPSALLGFQGDDDEDDLPVWHPAHPSRLSSSDPSDEGDWFSGNDGADEETPGVFGASDIGEFDHDGD